MWLKISSVGVEKHPCLRRCWLSFSQGAAPHFCGRSTAPCLKRQNPFHFPALPSFLPLLSYAHQSLQPSVHSGMIGHSWWQIYTPLLSLQVFWTGLGLFFFLTPRCIFTTYCKSKVDVLLLQPSIINDNIQARCLWAGLLASVIHPVRGSEEGCRGEGWQR